MWWLLSFVSAAFLGCYDSCKKLSLKDNAVIPVLFLNTLISTLLLSPLLVRTGFGSWEVQRWIFLKSAIVLSSWMAGYFAMKHLPLTLVGPMNATRPVLVLQNDAGNFFSPTLIVAPMSSQVDKRTDLPTHIVLEQVRGLDGPSLIMLEQLKTIDKRRVRSYAGKLTKEQMAEVEAALTGALGIYITEAVEAP